MSSHFVCWKWASADLCHTIEYKASKLTDGQMVIRIQSLKGNYSVEQPKLHKKKKKTITVTIHNNPQQL